MPLYVADYLADTADLDATGSGAYLFLIMHYWQHGRLPTDRKSLRRIARLTPRQAQKVIPHLARFFEPDWRHKRIERELQIADEKHEKLSMAGIVGRAKQRNKPWPGPGQAPGQAAHIYTKKITTTETGERSAGSVPTEEASKGTGVATDALRETIERKGWRS